MKSFVAGVVIGVVLGATAAAWPQTRDTWFTGARILDAPLLLRRGYAAGAMDMLAAVVAANKTLGLQFADRWFGRQLECMRSRTSGGLNQFTDWASGLWLGTDFQAASHLLDRACR